ncbi:unnamed protein product [Brassica rapa]|uniref:Uncharacterized protein n=2 Tax=Brassica TaxID=3705 RepID=A0A8D9DGA4_BRACM|nr:unnamed protein product [Brassica napus]CAG7875106.1 unnamed protein product [Brassica rapa]
MLCLCCIIKCRLLFFKKGIARECIGFLWVCFASLERTATEEMLLYMFVLFAYILR